MSDNVHKLPQRDLIAEMTGPKVTGNEVIIDGRPMPHVRMKDHGDEIEFILDDRFSFSFPRDIAWLAASFAFNSMAIGAGFASPSGKHSSQRAFAPEAIGIEMPAR